MTSGSKQKFGSQGLRIHRIGGCVDLGCAH